VETALDVVTDTNTFTAYPPCLPFTMYGVPEDQVATTQSV